MGEVPETRYARNGELHIAYQDLGGAGPDVLFLSHPQFPIDMMWDDPLFSGNLRRLAASGRLIACDLHGWGSSDQPSAPFPALQVWMDDIGAVLDTVGVRSASLVAHGEVARPAMLFAATHPDRVDRLVLINACARSRRAADYPAGMPGPRLDAEKDIYASNLGQGPITDWFAPSRAADPIFRRLSLRAERLSLRPGHIRVYLDLFIEADVRGILPSIQAETLVIHRIDNPHIRLDHARYLVEHVPRSRLVELPGTDFLWNSGDVDRLFDEIVAGLAGSPSRGSQRGRLLATVLFTDIVDSTAHAVRVGDSTWRTTLESFNALVASHVASARGQLVKWTGDGGLAMFDGPARAIRCAIGIRDAVHDLGLAIRAGLHTGEVELIGADIAGIAVHVGARVAALSATDQVLVSAAIPPLVMGSGIEFSEQGSHELKGVPGRWQVFEALA